MLLCGCRYELKHSEYVTKLPKGKHSTKGGFECVCYKGGFVNVYATKVGLNVYATKVGLNVYATKVGL